MLFKPKRCGFFLCFFLWLVVLFVVLIFVIKSSGKLCTCCALFAWEVVLLIFSTFSKSTAESTKKHNIKQRFSLSKICPLAKLVTEKSVP